MSLSEQVQRVDGGQNAALKKFIEKLGGTVPDGTKIDGYAALIEDMTIYAAAQQLSEETKTAYAMEGISDPDDILQIISPLCQYWWRKTVAEGYEEHLTAWSGQMYFMVCDMSQNSPGIQYASSVTIDQETGEVSLASPKSVSITVSNRNEVASTIRGKYILGGYSAPTSVIKIDDAAIIGTDYSGSSVYIRVNAAGAYVVTGIASSNIVTLVTSPNRDAYPDNGEQGGASYSYLGNFMQDGPGLNFEIGSYVGTGTSGNSNPTVIIVPPQTKFVFIVGEKITSAGSQSWGNAVFILPTGSSETARGYLGIGGAYGVYAYSVKWDGEQLSWSISSGNTPVDDQMNSAAAKYTCFFIRG